jgi:hypothetical protein
MVMKLREMVTEMHNKALIARIRTALDELVNGAA